MKRSIEDLGDDVFSLILEHLFDGSSYAAIRLSCKWMNKRITKFYKKKLHRMVDEVDNPFKFIVPIQVNHWFHEC